MSGNSEQKQSWAEAVIECVSDSAERERLIRMYDYDELVTACLALGTLALTAKHESARNKQLEEELAAARSETKPPLDPSGGPHKYPWQIRDEIIEEVAKEIESAPLTYAGPDPHVASDLRYLIVCAIRDLKGKQ